jgi:hypothetical protein
VFFDRAERRPGWAMLRTQVAAFPVEVLERAPFSPEFVSRIELEARRGSRTAVFQTTIAGDLYQVIARLLYEDEVRAALDGVFGFTVNRSHKLPGCRTNSPFRCVMKTGTTFWRSAGHPLPVR